VAISVELVIYYLQQKDVKDRVVEVNDFKNYSLLDPALVLVTRNTSSPSF